MPRAVTTAAEFAPTTVEIDDGTRVDVRCIRSSDIEALRAFFLSLSAESRFNRFHTYVTDLPPAMWQYLADVDGHDHFALVAQRTEHDGEGEGPIVGVARFIRLSRRTDAAEVAITTADELQGRGLGSALLGLLAHAAEERGVGTFVAHALPGNQAIRRSLAKLGELVACDDGCERSLEVSFRLKASDSVPSKLHPAMRAHDERDEKPAKSSMLEVTKGRVRSVLAFASRTRSPSEPPESVAAL